MSSGRAMVESTVRYKKLPTLVQVFLAPDLAHSVRLPQHMKEE